MNTKLAPVVILGYSRPDTLKKSLKNLSANYGLEDRDIYFFQDAPYRDEDISKVEAMHQVAVEAKNAILPHLIIVRREKNYGVPGNLLAAVRETVDKYGRIIFFEDDVLVSKSFVSHMDKGLTAYQSDKRIFCINGYIGDKVKVPKDYPHGVYLTFRNSAWGFATWKDRWDAVDFEMRDWPILRDDPVFMKRLHQAGCDMLPMAERTYRGEIKTWDIQCSVHIIQHSMYTVAPRFRLTRNIGFGADGGVNCRGTGQPQIRYYNFFTKMPQVLQPDMRIIRQLEYDGGDDRIFMRIYWRLKGALMRPIRCLMRPLRRELGDGAFEIPVDL